jgi:hypothetical protein
MVVALVVCDRAGRLGLGTVSEPDSGFIFFWSGAILAVLSLRLVIDSRRAGATEASEVRTTDWVKVCAVLAALLAYGFLLERLGFLAATFALMTVLLTINTVAWARSIAVAAAAALVSFAVFELWLKIRLPKGVFGF